LTGARTPIKLIENQSHLRPLDKLNAGERAYIVDMKNTLLCEKLFEMGVFPGDLVEVKENNANHSCMIVSINNQSFMIYKIAAQTIVTNVVHFQFALN